MKYLFGPNHRYNGSLGEEGIHSEVINKEVDILY